MRRISWYKYRCKHRYYMPLSDYRKQDITVLKNTSKETNDESYAIIVFEKHKDEPHGGKVIQQLNLNDYLFRLLCERIDIARKNWKEEEL